MAPIATTTNELEASFSTESCVCSHISHGKAIQHGPVAKSFLEEPLDLPLPLGFIAKPNLAVFVNKEHECYVQEIPFPRAKADECIVHVKCTGLCGSELHFLRTGGIGDFRITSPLIMGHESSGVVLSVGPLVKNLTIGDRVSIEPGVSCSACMQCERGKYNLCKEVKFCGTPPTHGTLARYVAHKGSFLHKIPDTMSFSHAALVEPISVSYSSLLRSSLQLATPTLILGAGPIGLSAISLAHAAGAYPIVVTDIAEHRLEWARKCGADEVVKVELGWKGEEVANAVRKMFEKWDIKPRVALECTGAVDSVFGAVYSLEDGGVLMQIGNGKNEQIVPFQSLAMREIDLRFNFRYTSTWPVIIRMLSAHRLPGIEETVTHTFKLEDSTEAFRVAGDPAQRSVKVQIVDEEL